MTKPTKRTRRGRVAHVLRSAATLVCWLLVFYGLPLRGLGDDSVATGLVLVAAGTAGLVGLVVVQVRRFVNRPDDVGQRVLGLLSVLYVVVVFFAAAYFLIERSDPAQFDGIRTRTDALYFAIVTLGTVGYGDVHPAGQLARVATTVQIVFDLVVIGALFAVMSSQIAHRLEVARSSRHVDDGTGS